MSQPVSPSAGPNFLVIGAAKSGTSALYNQLASHPEIFMSALKEPNFFAFVDCGAHFTGPNDADTINRRSVTDPGAYRALFARATGEQAIGEASTSSLYSPTAPEAIRRFNPEMKLIALLRNPVDRAFSSYRHLVRDGRETETFAGGLAAEDERIAAGWSHIWHYTEAGFYAPQLRRYKELFPPDQLAIFTYDRFSTEPEAVLREIFTFLGVDPEILPDTSRRYNVSGKPRFGLLHKLVIGKNPLKSMARPLIPRAVRRRVVSLTQSWNVIPEAPRMEPEIHARLHALFEGQIDELESEYGLDLSPWRA